MKKILSILAIFTLVLALAGCDKNDDKKEEVTVTFKYGDTIVDTKKVEKGSTVVKTNKDIPNLPENKELDFWGATAAATTEFDWSTKINEDTTLYAILKDKVVVEEKVTVTFKNGDATVDSKEINKGGKVTPTTETVTAPINKAFDFWGETADATTAFDFENTIINEDKILYAIFKDSFIEGTFEATGRYGVVPAGNGEHTGNMTVEFKLVVDNEDFDLSTANIKSGTEKIGETTRDLTINADLTYWANVLKEGIAEYTFITQDDLIIKAELDFSTLYNVATFERTETPISQLLLESHSDSSYYIEYLLKDSEGEVISITADVIAKVYAFNSTNEDKWVERTIFGDDPEFLQLATGDTGARYLFLVTLEGEFYLAKLDHKKIFTVTFVNETNEESVFVADGDLVTKPTNPTPTEGFAFDGWYLGDTKFDFTSPITDDLILNAQFKSTTILTKEDLIAYFTGEGDITADYKLGANIDLEATALTSNRVLKAKFDGQGFTISNFSQEIAEKGGLFRSINGGEVVNLIIDNGSIKSTAQRAGMIAGDLLGTANIDTISIVNSTVEANKGEGAGGILGQAKYNSTINNIQIINTTIKNNQAAAGGIVGQIDGSGGDITINITNIYINNGVEDKIVASERAAGVIGEIKGADAPTNDVTGDVVNVSNAVIITNIEAPQYISGILGRNNGSAGVGTFTDVYLEITLTQATIKYAGHVNGRNNSLVESFTNVFVVGTVATKDGEVVDAANVIEKANVNADWWTTNLVSFTTNEKWVLSGSIYVLKDFVPAV